MIPQEIVDFLQKDIGHSLIIKGEPGSGKTTLGLEILNYFRDKMRVFYLSTRVADDILLKQFPWVKDIINIKIKRIGGKIRREYLNKLEGLIEEGFMNDEVKFEGNEAILEVGELLPELELLYDFVENSLPEKSLICVDSIDGLSEKYGIPAEKILHTLQKDLVEGGFANIIFIVESAGFENIDYLGDGIISLHHESSEGFWIRTMLIKKLRGSPVRKPKYLYTLHEGHFSSLHYDGFSLDSASNIDTWDIEKIIKKLGNFGCLNIKFSKSVPFEILQSLILSLIKYSKKTPLIVPPLWYPVTLLKEHIDKFLGKEIKIAGYGEDKGDVYLEGKDMIVEMSPDIIEYQIGSNSLIIIGLDSLINLYENDNDIPKIIKDIKKRNSVILLTPENYNISVGVDREITMKKVEDVPILLSSDVYAVIPEENKGIKIRLIPLM